MTRQAPLLPEVAEHDERCAGSGPGAEPPSTVCSGRHPPSRRPSTDTWVSPAQARRRCLATWPTGPCLPAAPAGCRCPVTRETSLCQLMRPVRPFCHLSWPVLTDGRASTRTIARSRAVVAGLRRLADHPLVVLPVPALAEGSWPAAFQASVWVPSACPLTGSGSPGEFHP